MQLKTSLSQQNDFNGEDGGLRVVVGVVGQEVWGQHVDAEATAVGCD